MRLSHSLRDDVTVAVFPYSSENDLKILHFKKKNYYKYILEKKIYILVVEQFFIILFIRLLFFFHSKGVIMMRSGLVPLSKPQA